MQKYKRVYLQDEEHLLEIRWHYFARLQVFGERVLHRQKDVVTKHT